MILDEATSALDEESQKEVQQAIDKISSGKFKMTIVVIAHWLSTIKNADKIIVFDKGEVAEEGTHQDLIDKKGIYAKLVNHQQETE